MIPGLGREVEENCALLRYYAAFSGDSLPTLRYCISFPSSRVKNPRCALHDDKQGKNIYTHWEYVNIHCFSTATGYANAPHCYVCRYITCIVRRTYFVGGAPRTLPVVMHKVCYVKVVLSMSVLTCRFRDAISCCYETGRIIRIILLSGLYVWCLWKLWRSCPVMDGAPRRLSMPLMLFLFSPALTVSDILKNVPDRPTIHTALYESFLVG